jgi:hypothetical protein
VVVFLCCCFFVRTLKDVEDRSKRTYEDVYQMEFSQKYVSFCVKIISLVDVNSREVTKVLFFSHKYFFL